MLGYFEIDYIYQRWKGSVEAELEEYRLFYT